MRRLMRRLLLLLLVLAWPTLALAGDDDSGDDDSAESEPMDPGPGTVVVIEFDDIMINRGSKAYFIETLEAAQKDPDIRALVLVMDTPGGALDATREIVKAELASELPIIVYVSPTGSRAASAGVFITMAAHVAAMAPATNIGAAHPVFMGGGGPKKDETDEEAEERKDSQVAMLEKVTNDTAAFARNIAKTRGRNEEWAEQSVRESVSITVEEALEKNVVDLQATSLEELLEAIDGRIIEFPSGKRTVLHTMGPIRRVPMSTQNLILLLLSNPTISYLLLLAGLAGWYIEFQNPGVIVPATVGSICLLLFGFSLSAIPVNLLAVVFVLLGFALLFVEVYVGAMGIAAIAAAGAIALGGVFLVDQTPEFDVGVDPTAILLVTALTILGGHTIGWLVVRGQLRKVVGGSEGMVGETGAVTVAIPGGRAKGRVFVHSELWGARSSRPLEAGRNVRVVAIRGLELEVVPVDDGPAETPEET
jgi:membrane-bound serine protease (ClpP class)